ncbi:hypothetical protein PUN28_006613 [Cardiocondyla obscurior]|uniref:Uncharacterized protein n=1 Tax=Cardiocondyla obscurior TaxID=286306 RepID=A0AAW2GEH2_9HYME
MHPPIDRLRGEGLGKPFYFGRETSEFRS